MSLSLNDSAEQVHDESLLIISRNQDECELDDASDHSWSEDGLSDVESSPLGESECTTPLVLRRRAELFNLFDDLNIESQARTDLSRQSVSHLSRPVTPHSYTSLQLDVVNDTPQNLQNNDSVSIAATNTLPSTESSSSIACRICGCRSPTHTLVSPCKCDGSLKYVHTSCLQKWIDLRPRRRDDDDIVQATPQRTNIIHILSNNLHGGQSNLGNLHTCELCKDQYVLTLRYQYKHHTRRCLSSQSVGAALDTCIAVIMFMSALLLLIVTVVGWLGSLRQVDASGSTLPNASDTDLIELNSSLSSSLISPALVTSTPTDSTLHSVWRDATPTTPTNVSSTTTAPVVTSNPLNTTTTTLTTRVLAMASPFQSLWLDSLVILFTSCTILYVSYTLAHRHVAEWVMFNSVVRIKGDFEKSDRDKRSKKKKKRKDKRNQDSDL